MASARFSKKLISKIIVSCAESSRLRSDFARFTSRDNTAGPHTRRVLSDKCAADSRDVIAEPILELDEVQDNCCRLQLFNYVGNIVTDLLASITFMHPGKGDLF
jgi:hypothetical protein